MEEHFNYFSDWREQQAHCTACGWTGSSLTDAFEELFDALIEFTCPACNVIITMVSYPTLDEIEEAAEKGNSEAIKMLKNLQKT